MNNPKFLITANPASGEETSLWDNDEVLSIKIEADGTLTVYTTDDSTCTYLSDEWLRLELVGNDS